MIKKIIILSTLLITINSLAQKNNVSPYSFFGIGDVSDIKSVFESSMGGIGTASNSSFRLSFSNPASLASLKFTTYSLAGTNNFIIIDDGNNKQESSAFSLSYLALGFPVGKNAGFAFGIQPYSKSGYSILDKFTNNESENVSNLFFGEGGSNRVFAGYGYKFPYQISLGVEVSYIFGNLEKTILFRNEDQPARLASLNKTETNISGYSLKVGVHHQAKINEKIKLKTGLTAIFENEIDEKGKEYLFSLRNVAVPDFISARDTVVNRSFNGKIKIPLKTTLSTGVGKDNKWFAGIEYSFQDAIDFQEELVLNNNTINYVKFDKISIGGFYTPKMESLTSYWKRVTYSLGTHFTNTGLKINNTELSDFGISFGVSLPSGRSLSNINFGFDIGQRGEIKDSLIKENYFNFRLGLSLSDKWFKKRKLD